MCSGLSVVVKSGLPLYPLQVKCAPDSGRITPHPEVAPDGSAGTILEARKAIGPA